MSSLLVVEDDVTIGASLASALVANGHQVVLCATGAAAYECARRNPPQLVLLDLGLPDVGGLDVCRELRAMLPFSTIIIVTARNEPIDVVSGLESGADDYLTKPFSVIEVLARVRAHLRRSEAVRDSGEEKPGMLTVGSLCVDGAARRVLVGSVEVALRAREFDLLERFVREPGAAISREDLMADVWDSNWFGSTKTLDVHVASLRRLLGGAAESQGDEVLRRLPRIVTLRGHGYRMDASSV
jgi:DNA-binding response OmpR family regulator